jgi:hypothetical protein
MPEISQRTLGKVIGALGALLPEWADTYPEIRKFWRTKLFEAGFPEWLIDFAIDKSGDWSQIIPELYGRKVKTRDHYLVGKAPCQQMLCDLTVFAYSESEDRRVKESIRLSLQLDGFEVGPSRLQSIDGFASAEQEKSRLLGYLKSSKLGRQDVIAKHISDAEDLFNQGKNHSALGEARSAFQAVLEETVSVLESKLSKKSGGTVKDKINFLTQEGVFSPDEQQATFSAWGFLSAGNHPGLPSEEEGRIGTILCLEFIQMLLIKGSNLL